MKRSPLKRGQPLKRTGRPRSADRPTVVLRCDRCRREFRRRADQQTRSATGTFCNSCSKSVRSQGRVLPSRRKGAMLTCPQCGTEFYRGPSAIRLGARFCSRPCHGAWERAQPRLRVPQVDNSGKRNGRYKHGQRVGAHITKAKVRAAVAERDGDWCLLCGRPPRGLHLHRVRYGSEGGRYEVPNCVQLCGLHHDLVHSNKRVWQPMLVRFLAGDPEALGDLRRSVTPPA